MEHRTTAIEQTLSKKEKKIFCSDKLKRFFRQTKSAQEERNRKTDLLSALSASQSELETIRNHLSFVTDTDCTEICIYRLKAAELDLNRRIKLAKTDLYSGKEESL